MSEVSDVLIHDMDYSTNKGMIYNQDSPYCIEIIPTESKTQQLNPRKRKSSSTSNSYKVKRKSVEKIHISVEEPNLHHLSSPSHFLSTNPEDDDVTEKYLTKSSKPAKKINTLSDSDQFKYSVIEMGNNTEDKQDIVVIFPPEIEAQSTKEAKKNSPILPNESFQYSNALDQSNTLYIESPFHSQGNTPILPNSNDSNLMYINQSEKVKLSANTSPTKKSKLYMKRDTLSANAEQTEDPVRNVWVTSKGHKEQLKEKGHTWTTGMWSKEEVNILIKNINKYCQDHDIEDPSDMIFNRSKEQRKDFYPSISNGLNRPLFAVYRRVKRMYDKQNYKGKYSEEEVQKLKILHERYGRDWTSIAQHLGRSSDSVKDRCRLLKLDNTAGKWSKREESGLAKCVHMVTNTEPGTSVTENISWNLVSEMMETRSEKQCRAKWLYYLNWKMLKGQEWTKLDDKLLVERIAKLNVESDNEINWSELCEGWKSARSPQWLRCKWSGLKKLLLEFDLVDLNFVDTVKLLQNLYSEQVMEIMERPRKLFKRIMGKQTVKKIKPAKSKNIIDLDLVEPEECDDITTCIVSQEDETSTAPLFIQSSSQDPPIPLDLNPSSPSPQIYLRENLNSIVRPRTLSELNSTPAKYDFQLPTDNVLLGDNNNDGGMSLPTGTYHLTPTSLDGIYLIHSDPQPSGDVTLGADNNNVVSITLAPDALSSLLKLNNTNNLQTDADLNLNNKTESEFMLSQPNSDPDLGVSEDRAGETDLNNCLLQSSTHLTIERNIASHLRI